MRRRFFSAFVLILCLLSFCACGRALPQTAVLSPFSADLTFTENDTVFEGAFSMQDGGTMQLLLGSPRALQGLLFSFENGEATLRRGDAVLSLNDAEALTLPPTVLSALCEALCALSSAPQKLDPDYSAEVASSRGTAKLFFAQNTLLPLRAELGGVSFRFENVRPAVT